MRRFGRLLSRLGWYGLPSLAVLIALSYIGLSMAWHVNPPITAVQGTSMEPFLVTGDLVFLHGVNPAALRKGDVVAVVVPRQDQTRYGLPPRVVHRIIAVYHTPAGLVFQTKGDNNPGPDVFRTPAADIVGEMTGKLPYLGYPLLFFQSKQGIIFLGSAAGLVLIYLFLGFLDKRKEEDPRVVVMESVLDETRQLRADIAAFEEHTSPPFGQVVPAAGEAPPADDLVRRLAEAVAAGAEVTAGNARSNDELVAAVSEYGEHLRSHTEAVQSMAAAAVDLKAITAALQELLTGTAAFPPELVDAPERPAVVPLVAAVGAPGPETTPFGGEGPSAARGGRTVATREIPLEMRGGEASGQGEIVDMVAEAVTELLADTAALHDIELAVEFVTIGAEEPSLSPWSCVLGNGSRSPGRTIAVRVEDWSGYGLSLATYIFDDGAPPVAISLGVASRAVVADGEDSTEGVAIVDSIALIASVEPPADELLGSGPRLLEAIALQLAEPRS